MKNKQHECIIKAFLESNIPTSIRKYAPELMIIESAIGGYCTQLVQGAEHLNIVGLPLISKNDKKCFSVVINELLGKEKEELIFYYRLLILVEAIIIQYQ